MRIILAAVLALTALPAAAQMYKCVDERGVTHYSDKPRPGCKGGPVNIQASPPIAGSIQAAPSDLAEQDADFKRRQIERERAEAAGKAALAERCAATQREYGFYSSGGRLVRLESGKAVYVDDATREAKLASLREVLRGCP